MLILGINFGVHRPEDETTDISRHDAAAVLLLDGSIIAAIEEERLDRLKHSNCFPRQAIDFCLKTAGVTFDQLDFIALNGAEGTSASLRRLQKRRFLTDPGAPPAQENSSFVAGLFASYYNGVDLSAKFHFCHHHLSHAASAYYASGFDRSLVVSVDGDGDSLSGMILTGEGNRLTKLRELPLQQSLGHWYASLIAILGYGVFDEYKVMGLAPYGDPTRFAPLFENHYSLFENGDFSLDPLSSWYRAFDEHGLFQSARRKGSPFTQDHRDFAAALQQALERILYHMVAFHRRQSGLDKLCLAGGVAHNCSANGKILYSGLFDEIFVQPASHDAGGALGAALHCWSQHQPPNSPPLPPLRHVYYGTDVNARDVEPLLRNWTSLVDFEHHDDIIDVAAQLMAKGHVIGWVQGKSEFGPRALGNRSILADPRPQSNRDRINQMVKKRESYRPFAPSVIEEAAAEYFVLPGNQQTFPFMVMVLQVRPGMQSLLGAVTHVDGSARVHTVSAAGNPLYWKLIRKFGDLTGVPILLNTSFNNAWEPIVDSAEDALTCFLTTDLDYLIVNNFLVRKKLVTWQSLAPLVPAVPPHYRLVQRSGNGARVWEVTSLKSSRLCNPKATLSEAAFHLMLGANGHSSLDDLVPCGDVERLTHEIIELWSNRFLTMRMTNRRPVNGFAFSASDTRHTLNIANRGD